MKTIKSRCGFTLIELLIVIAILGILTAMFLPMYSQRKERQENFQKIFHTQYPTTKNEVLASRLAVVTALIELKGGLESNRQMASMTDTSSFTRVASTVLTNPTPAQIIEYVNAKREVEKAMRTQVSALDEQILQCKKAFNLARQAGYGEEVDALGYVDRTDNYSGRAIYPFPN